MHLACTCAPRNAGKVPEIGRGNHCNLHCRLAKVRGLKRRGKYGAMIGQKSRCFVCARFKLLVPGYGFMSSQSQRRIYPFSSNHGISPNDSVSYPSHRKVQKRHFGGAGRGAGLPKGIALALGGEKRKPVRSLVSAAGHLIGRERLCALVSAVTRGLRKRKALHGPQRTRVKTALRRRCAACAVAHFVAVRPRFVEEGSHFLVTAASLLRRGELFPYSAWGSAGGDGTKEEKPLGDCARNLGANQMPRRAIEGSEHAVFVKSAPRILASAAQSLSATFLDLSKSCTFCCTPACQLGGGKIWNKAIFSTTLEKFKRSVFSRVFEHRVGTLYDTFGSFLDQRTGLCAFNASSKRVRPLCRPPALTATYYTLHTQSSQTYIVRGETLSYKKVQGITQLQRLVGHVVYSVLVRKVNLLHMTQ